MDANSCDINRFKAKVNKFSGIISRDMKKPEKNFIRQIIYGIQCCKDVKISNIIRCLKESIKLIKTENRLCNHLRDNDFTQKINHEVLRLGKEKITNDMVISIDPGDIKKPYAKAMENLCGIYDASQKEKATGYHMYQVTGANLEHNKIVPLLFISLFLLPCQVAHLAKMVCENQALRYLQQHCQRPSRI